MMKRIMLMLAAAVMLSGAVPAMADCGRVHSNDPALTGTAKKTDPLAAKILAPYLSLRKSLAADNVKTVKSDAAGLLKALNSGLKSVGKDEAKRGPLERLKSNAELLAKNNLNLAKARDAFALLSDDLVSYFKTSVAAADAKMYDLYYCEMAKHPWIQKSGEKIGNPYYGKEMPECGRALNKTGPAGTKMESHDMGNMKM